MEPLSDGVAIGVVRRPHGVRGAVKIHSFSGETRHFKALREVELRRHEARRRLAVRSVEIHNDTPVLFLEGVDDRDAAAALAGFELWVSAVHAAPLEHGEFYIRDLIGMSVMVQDDTLGPIIAVVEGAQAPLLEVDTGAGTVLIPFMEPFAGVPDETRRTVELLTPWILDME